MAIFAITNPNLPADPNSYVLVASVPLTCTGTDFICSIQGADNGNGQPVIDFPLLSEIATALNTRTPSTNVTLQP